MISEMMRLHDDVFQHDGKLAGRLAALHKGAEIFRELGTMRRIQWHELRDQVSPKGEQR